MTDPPVKALVVYNSNPAAIAPNQNAVRRGLQRGDLFTVVLEQFQNDTADFADFLLPATTFLEHTDLYYAYGHYYLQLARPALAPPGETKSNVEVFRALAARMGFDDPCFSDSEDDMIRTLLDSDHPFVRGITLEDLEREHFVRLRVAPPGDPFLPFANGGFGTPSGKCEFRAESIDVHAARGIPPWRRELARALPAGIDLTQERRQHELDLRLSPGERRGHRHAARRARPTRRRAASRTGDRVRVYNDRGSCLLRAQVDGVVRPGVVCAPAVRWAKHVAGPAQRECARLRAADR